MNNTKILEMLENGQIEDLKTAIKQEIYTDSLKGKSGAKERYKAMLRFVKYNRYHEFTNKEGLTKPKKINEKYYFTNGHCIVETIDNIGEIQAFSEETDGKFVDIESVIKEAGMQESILVDIKAVLSRAKAEGYKFTSRLLSGTGFNNLNGKFLIKFNDTYINVALLDYAYSVIDDGKPAEVEYISQYGGIWITTSVGRAIVLPIRYDEYNKDRGEIIIDAMQEMVKTAA